MASFGTEPSETYRPGQRLGPGAISGMSQKQIDQVVGGGDVQVKQVGRRLVVSSKKRKGASVGGGGSVIWLGEYTTLPAVPSTGGIYFITRTGDSQAWMAYGGGTEWTPCQYLTSLSGTP